MIIKTVRILSISEIGRVCNTLSHWTRDASTKFLNKNLDVFYLSHLQIFKSIVRVKDFIMRYDISF